MRAWSSASIRARLTAWYTAVLFLMMAIYATVTFLAVRHEFYEQLEDHPRAAQIPSGAPIPNCHSPL